jgi:hypothetical protein
VILSCSSICIIKNSTKLKLADRIYVLESLNVKFKRNRLIGLEDEREVRKKETCLIFELGFISLFFKNG